MKLQDSIALLQRVEAFADTRSDRNNFNLAVVTLLLELERRTRQPTIDDEVASIINRFRTIG